MYRKHLLSIILFICTYLLNLVPLSAQEEEGEIIIISERVGKEIDMEERDKFKLFQNLSKPQTVSSDPGKIPARKADAGSSRKKTLCLSIGFGYPIYDGGPQPSLAVPDVALSLRLLEFPIAFMYDEGGGALDHGSHEWDYSLFNILYMIPLSKSKKTTFFLGGGIGDIKEEADPSEPGSTRQKYTLYNIEVGCNPRLIGFLGSYAKVRYLYSKWSNSRIQFILGIDFNFHFRI